MGYVNKSYGRLDGEEGLIYAPESVKLDGRIILHPSRENYAALGWLLIVDEPPSEPAPEGYRWQDAGWEETADGCLRRTWTLSPVPLPPLAEYDAAMEAHLRAEREARGYTTREPDAYLESAVPRWKQDAEDWVAHRDAVMTYALAIMNEVEAGTREPPTVEEFSAGLPRIVWTYADAEEA